ncbi:hypothetical protein OF122_11265 [Pelagibacterium flavum]|uniref:Uncharacterized protein n=1 Tax=Pelagibacterium flavum TaxID=2984530 RepID=A0ABY6IJ81_9HYPH|nr:hypothetical protein [Pelagibacterium sp. YIM 151497]UYQ70653.1 hypothetical protein OF122_11265 [Pelagibacterium sp. YIM 151497]
MLRALILSATLCLYCTTSAVAQSSEALALQGSKAWGAFRCAGLAKSMSDMDEHLRLTSVGYKNASAFVEAYQQGRIQQGDIERHIASGVILELSNEPVDFVVARIALTAEENAQFLAGNGQPLTNLQASVAFTNQNCRHL